MRTAATPENDVGFGHDGADSAGLVGGEDANKSANLLSRRPDRGGRHRTRMHLG